MLSLSMKLIYTIMFIGDIFVYTRLLIFIHIILIIIIFTFDIVPHKYQANS